MARSLSFLLDQVQVNAERRSPGFVVYVYDVLARDGVGDFYNSLGDIVRGDVALAPSVGPRDFTGDVLSLQVHEQGGDYTGAGVAASVVTLRILDPHALFDPATVVDDADGDGRWLRRGNVVRVLVGDFQVPIEEWPVVFTGKLTGNSGVARSRAGGVGPVSEIQCKAVSREGDFLRYNSTSNDFSIGTSYLTIAETIAEEDMGLDADEVELAGFSAFSTGHTSTQFVAEPPLVSIAKLMFPSGLVPYFDGYGRLAQVSGSISKGATRIYEDDDLFLLVETVFGEVNPYNRVTVRGLDANLSRVVQPQQVLAEIQVTTGFFSQGEEIEAFWSEDRTILADDIDLEIVKSVNGGLLPLGGSESFSELAAPGPGEGTIGAVLEIDTGYASELIIFLTVAYVALAAIPDTVQTIPLEGTGFTIPIGRIEEATQLALMLLIMCRQGSGTYRFTGTPFEYVYRELLAIAEVDGVRIEDQNELSIDNHLLQTQAMCDDVAREVLFREQAKGNPRSVVMLHDLALQPNDVFELISGRRFLVDTIDWTVERAPAPIVARVTCFEITPGSFQL